MAGDLTGVILAAGRGTRMHPFSERWPKPILPIMNRPLIEHQIEMMRSVGIARVHVVIGHLGHEVVRALGDGSRQGVELNYVEQRETLGIAHAVGNLEPLLDGPFLLFLGDIFFETDSLQPLADEILAGRAQAALATKREPDAEAIRRNFAVVTDGESRRVRRVIEKPRRPATDLKGCGLYLFDVHVFDAIRRTPRTAMRDEYEITDAIQIMIDDGHVVTHCEVIHEDLNLTYPDDLLAINLRGLRQCDLVNLIDPTALVHPEARLQRCVVGAGARMDHAISLEECVVLPGAAAPPQRDLRRAIVTPTGVIPCAL
jgi:dTDP-glucose pyrophosphorylase